MTTFLQLHILTAYGPSNLNRDDTGRPKTAVFGGAERLRISSQSLKRAWRTSSVFSDAVGGQESLTTGAIGTKSRQFFDRIVQKLIDNGFERAAAISLCAAAIPKAISKKDESENDDETTDEEPQSKKKDKKPKKDKTGKLTFGSLQTEAGKETMTNEIVHLSPEELANIDALAEKLIRDKKVNPKEVTLLLQKPKAVDIAMFGRMLADNPEYNVEAAVQVAHAMTTHKAIVEDDYFTAVDDLKGDADDRGAGMIGVQEYGSGVFYIYVCIDRDLLLKNLSADQLLTRKAIEGLARAATQIAPGGKQNSFASRARATYVLAERGDDQPRSLAVAFLKPVKGDDPLNASVDELERARDQLDKAYGDGGRRSTRMNANTSAGTLTDIIRLLTE